MKFVPLQGGGVARIHTGGDCCDECKASPSADEARWQVWYAEKFPEQAARSADRQKRAAS